MGQHIWGNIADVCPYAQALPSCCLQDTINEAKVLAQFNHVNIVHYHGLVLEVGSGVWGWTQCAG